MQVGDVCACRHTAESADEQKKSASIAIHIPASDERQMQLQKNQPDENTRFPVNSTISRTSMF